MQTNSANPKETAPWGKQEAADEVDALGGRLSAPIVAHPAQKVNTPALTEAHDGRHSIALRFAI